MTPAPTQPDSKAVALSGRLFQRLLAAYPKAHRREYGPAMAQLFRDQCRDAWRAGRGWGLTWLWLRVLPDLVKTSVVEHLSTLKERITMLERLGMLLRPRSAPWLVFSGVFILEFCFVVATTTLITFIMPESYAGTSKILLRPQAAPAPRYTEAKPFASADDSPLIQSQLEVVKSDAVLNKVIEELDLNNAWGRKLLNGERLSTPETLAILKHNLVMRPLRNTGLIEIRAFSDNPVEASDLANAVVRSYCAHGSRMPAAGTGGLALPGVRPASIQTIQTAVPGPRPVRPNKPLNIVLGIVGGLLLASVIGGGLAGLAACLGRKARAAGTHG